jgi:phenylalanyl-tRNA synthetase alpha subunit
METTNSKETPMTGRHPIHQVADFVQKAFLEKNFSLVDNSEGLEIEKFDITFPTWKEPEDIFGWQNDPIRLRHDCTILRTRLLPSHSSPIEDTFAAPAFWLMVMCIKRTKCAKT